MSESVRDCCVDGSGVAVDFMQQLSTGSWPAAPVASFSVCLRLRFSSPPSPGGSAERLGRCCSHVTSHVLFYVSEWANESWIPT